MKNATDLQNPVFSICIPTYNRGLTALMNVRIILPLMDENWELLILDNGSHKEIEGYQQIEQLMQTDSRLRYIRHPSNLGFHNNFLAAFDAAKSPHIMLISDEDFANTDTIRQILPRLQSSPELAVLRGSVTCIAGQRPRNVFKCSNITFSKGEDALLGFCLRNTYMSGVIFNRELLIKNDLIELARKSIQENAIYPHLYLELLASAQFDVAFTEEIVCAEGLEKPTEGNVPMAYAPPYSFGSRVDQFITLRNGIYQATRLMSDEFDHILFIKAYLNLCYHYMRLISKVNKPLYMKNQLHLGLLQDSFFQIMGAAIFAYPELELYSEGIFTTIQKIYNEFRIKEEPIFASPEHQAEVA